MRYVLSVSLVLAASTCFAEIRGSGQSPKKNYMGSLGESRYSTKSISNPYSYGSKYHSKGAMNPYSAYGSKYSNRSRTNPYATRAPSLYQNGNYRGNWSPNRYAPNSTSNKYGRYGSKYSPESLNNPYGAGSPYRKPVSVWGK